MKRPVEYENLIKSKALEEVQPTAGAIAQYLGIDEPGAVAEWARKWSASRRG